MRTFVYAHRGANRRAPENTLRAFALAIEEGADGVELDVRTCADGTVVVAHDPHLGRVGERAAWIAMLPWERVRAVRLGDGERVPLLDEAIDLVVGAGLRLNVEVKSDVPDRGATVRAVAAALSRRSAAEREAIVLSSFDPRILRALRAALRGVPIGYLFDLEHPGPLRAAMLERALRPDGLHPHFSLCSPRAIRRWRARGLFVNAWTVNDPGRALELAGAGIDAIITDDVPRVRAALGLARGR
ncbi:MAG TPA: glycerophosphodiester phosphodiesterase [Sandaracinaceae bacterium]